MGVSGGLYNLVLLLHILTVVVGFGSFISSAPYARLARQRGGSEGLAIAEASASVTERVAQGSFYAVPVLGILLVVLSDGAIGFEEPWISLSFLLYIAAAVILRVVVIPAQRRSNAVAAELVANPGGKGAHGGELEKLGQRLAAFGGVFNLLFVAILALMIWKPGV
ncbi:MAG: DUF2269 domain-containing protein [Actinomycetota bacterium]|jgi:uncharacterized membrane protein|nr:DUF2269 domain-containing protein [Actinomycetota bacterium]